MIGTARSPLQFSDVEFSTDQPKRRDELAIRVIGRSEVDVEVRAHHSANDDVTDCKVNAGRGVDYLLAYAGNASVCQQVLRSV